MIGRWTPADRLQPGDTWDEIWMDHARKRNRHATVRMIAAEPNPWPNVITIRARDLTTGQEIKLDLYRGNTRLCITP